MLDLAATNSKSVHFTDTRCFFPGFHSPKIEVSIIHDIIMTFFKVIFILLLLFCLTVIIGFSKMYILENNIMGI